MQTLFTTMPMLFTPFTYNDMSAFSNTRSRHPYSGYLCHHRRPYRYRVWFVHNIHIGAIACHNSLRFTPLHRHQMRHILRYSASSCPWNGRGDCDACGKSNICFTEKLLAFCWTCLIWMARSSHWEEIVHSHRESCEYQPLAPLWADQCRLSSLQKATHTRHKCNRTWELQICAEVRWYPYVPHNRRCSLSVFLMSIAIDSPPDAQLSESHFQMPAFNLEPHMMSPVFRGCIFHLCGAVSNISKRSRICIRNGLIALCDYFSFSFGHCFQQSSDFPFPLSSKYPKMR